MKKISFLLILLLLLSLFPGCSEEEPLPSTTETANGIIVDTIDLRYTPQGISTWLDVIFKSGNYAYTMLNSEYGQIMTEDEFSALCDQIGDANYKRSEVCILRTYDDGTRVLITLMIAKVTYEGIQGYTVKSIEILP